MPKVESFVRRSNNIADNVNESLRDASRILIGKVEQYYKQIKDLDAIDALQAQRDIEALLDEAGITGIGANEYGAAYNEMLSLWDEYYDDALRSNIKYAPSVLTDLQVLRDADYIRYQGINTQLGGLLQEQLIKLRYGATSFSEASAIIRDSIDGYMNRYVYTWINTSLSNFSTQSNTAMAKENGIELFEYVGPVDKLTRPFCMDHIGERHTEEEWMEIQNDNGEPAWLFRGSWNCRHDLVGVVPEAE